ncbi:MAG TPA: tetratricopeptide repeat protein [Candidatus Polarisedimenticolia bacterium]|nr:tetratricopeptide repeat protein [Candidatus Polarisedimenticolia bacterium]
MKTTSRKSTPTKGKKTPAAKPKPAPARTAILDMAIKTYEEALKLFTRKEFSKAAHQFEDVIKSYPLEREVCDRARIYLSLCKAQVSPPPAKSKMPEDAYYLGVMAVNDGRLEEAAELFEKAFKHDPTSDKATYALGGVYSLMNDRSRSLAALARSIELNPSNKIQALNDADFDPLHEDPEFLALVGKRPEGGA